MNSLRTYPSKIFRRIFGLFWPIFDSFWAGSIRSVIQPAQNESKTRLKRTENSTETFYWDRFTHSFKVRGAFNALLSLTPAQKSKGIVTRSSGNFAQAIAYAGQLLNIKIRIVMPTNAPEIKKLATWTCLPMKNG